MSSILVDTPKKKEAMIIKVDWRIIIFDGI